MKLNELSLSALEEALSKCCGATAWVKKMLTIFPVKDEDSLLAAATRYWHECSPADWLEAFDHHPKIGGQTTSKWAAQEQSSVAHTTPSVLQALATGNQLYQEKFGYIFIVCATGKPAEEMLSLLNERLTHTPSAEIKIAMEEQDKITRIRLKKLLAS
ncbi:2-oxo-4-hydroxy-4-carboxy-5-ureidoimidazoline decarboxylase [Chitinophaga sp. CF118]|uniref:2-oxo-4-hydroxy-4-carboxy-5-ureidoimidazoline decarboxylase n=1 Tax=Chitinophaga sp. CF118 TaxID=1884367 RepID=UPI0008E96EB4|nr:2-oxo-4-hydroxy-4-carboxy-5-ureidoimidazoline decarboxylase [Chitinophaga sp. CF118]SFD60838.1 2-oxo-4-hydroxy-4-carboxy-5-ureidoimidazoline decarboxylase [Chitinophaga sp. CF118]